MDKGLDGLLTRAVSSDRVPGVIAGYADSQGMHYHFATGCRSLAPQTPMETDTVCAIASMTKAVAGAAVMQLVERGDLDLNVPAGLLLPYLNDVMVLDRFDTAGQPVLRPPKTPVTLRQLLTHTSGFAYEFWNVELKKYREATGHAGTLAGTIDGLKLPLVFDPGTAWDYGTGIDWAGLMLEAVTGDSLKAYLEVNIFGPLRMQDTGYIPTPSMTGRLATVYARTPDGLQPFKLNRSGEPEFYGGGGGLYSTVSDYLRFCRMILREGELDGERILKKETVADMSTNAMGPIRVRPLPSTSAYFSNDAEFFPGVEKTWGLTFQINEADAPTGRSAGSLSWAGMFNTYFWIDPHKDLAGVLMTQLLPFADHDALAVFEEFETAGYGLVT
ncbi:MAG: serine hydrolase [Proteobacteria bacterium]|nr:serine hydrolase [Pseudomonadota bacterium]